MRVIAKEISSDKRTPIASRPPRSGRHRRPRSAPPVARWGALAAGGAVSGGLAAVLWLSGPAELPVWTADTGAIGNSVLQAPGLAAPDHQDTGGFDHTKLQG